MVEDVIYNNNGFTDKTENSISNNLVNTLNTESSNTNEKLNYLRLYNTTLLTKRILDLLIVKLGDNTLTQVKDKESLLIFKDNIEEIIANKLKNRYL